jgi:uncharacterized protein YbjQ (UPF0145 family)
MAGKFTYQYKLEPKNFEDITIVTTDHVISEEIEETLGYVSSSYLTWFFLNKNTMFNKALDKAMPRILKQSLKDGADGIIDFKTSIDIQSHTPFISRINVFMEGTMVTFISEK